MVEIDLFLTDPLSVRVPIPSHADRSCRSAGSDKQRGAIVCLYWIYWICCNACISLPSPEPRCAGPNVGRTSPTSGSIHSSYVFPAFSSSYNLGATICSNRSFLTSIAFDVPDHSFLPHHQSSLQLDMTPISIPVGVTTNSHQSPVNNLSMSTHCGPGLNFPRGQEHRNTHSAPRLTTATAPWPPQLTLLVGPRVCQAASRSSGQSLLTLISIGYLQNANTACPTRAVLFG